MKSKSLQTFSIFSVVVRSDSVKAKVNFGIRIVHFALHDLLLSQNVFEGIYYN